MQGISTVRLDGVTKLYEQVRALAGVTLEVASGEVVAVMGANGAGKSTLLNMLSLTSRPTRGRIFFNGCPAEEITDTLRRKIGLLSHDPLVYPDLTARENLVFFARLYGDPAPDDRIEKLVDTLGMAEITDAKPTRLLSRGQLQRVALARALIATPDLLLLDEPAAGLDKRAVHSIEEAVDSLKQRGGLAVVVTHEPEMAAAIATRAVMINRGRVVEDIDAPGDPAGWRDLYFDTMGGGAS